MSESRRVLGRTGLFVSRVGLGTVKIGRNTKVKYPTAFELPTDKAVGELLDSALALGVNLFDTAPAYGESEARIGAFVKAHRKEIVLVTKAGEHFGPAGSTFDFTGKGIEASLEESLRRLKTDAVDVLLLHSDGRDLEILSHSDVVGTLLRLKSAGKTRAVGISAKAAPGVREAIRSLDVVMAPFSKGAPALGEALSEAHRAGLGVLAIKVLESGHAGSAADAIRFAADQPFLDSLIVGTLNATHLKEAVQAAR